MQSVKRVHYYYLLARPTIDFRHEEWLVGTTSCLVPEFFWAKLFPLEQKRRFSIDSLFARTRLSLNEEQF